MRKMISFNGSAVGLSVAMLVAGLAPAWAGCAVPAPLPLAGVTGPVGLVAAGLAYGGYLLYKRHRES